MTVIAYDGTHLATDRQATSGGVMLPMAKSLRLKDGTVLAWAGSSSQGLIMADLYKRKQLIKQWPEFQLDIDTFQWFIAARKGKVVFYENLPVAVPLEVPFYAWGSGREVAIGALTMGASAAQAVEVASRWESTCGQGVDNYLLL